MINRTRATELYERAQTVIAGGVSSDIRRPVPGRVPMYVDRAKGARLWDVDGNEYLDYVLGQGPQFFGHSHPVIVEAVQRQMARSQVFSAQHELEIEVAELVCELVPCAELVRFNSVGSEAVHGAWRLARGVTGRHKILKFEGHYHGWYDSELISVRPPLEEAGSAQRPQPVLSTAGQDPAAATNLVVAPWNDAVAFEQILDEHDGEIAAVVLEPWLCNTGCIRPDDDFLATVRSRTRRDGIVLIFDEVITGFRLAPGGAQQLLGVTPDLAVFGKAMAGGLPLACIAGSKEVMGGIVRGDVMHAGTFNSNPVVMSSAAAALGMIKESGDALYDEVRGRGKRLMDGITSAGRAHGVPMMTDGPGTVFQAYVTEAAQVRNYRDYVANVDVATAGRLYQALFDRGVNTVNRGLWFMSAAHTDDDVDQTLEVVDQAFAEVAQT
jgi:glutamate-1-semialdehyde 2,1-aminomutase